MAARSWIEEEEQINQVSSLNTSGVSNGPALNNFHEVAFNGMLKLEEESNEYIDLKHRFYMSIDSLSQNCTVVAAYRNLHPSPMGRAQSEVFRIFANAMAEKRGGNASVMYAWFGALKDEVARIMNDGFSVCKMQEDVGPFGFGLCLYPELSAGDSVLSSPPESDGLKHLVLCRVILGNTEELPPGSRQCAPSSGEFDSGVDNNQRPSRYIIWYSDIRTHILPIYAVSVKLGPHSTELQREPEVQQDSEWMPLKGLLYALYRVLPPTTMSVIRRFHNDYMEEKITRRQLVTRIRDLIGGKLLAFAVKDLQDKKRQGLLAKGQSRYR